MGKVAGRSGRVEGSEDKLGKVAGRLGMVLGSWDKLDKDEVGLAELRGVKTGWAMFTMLQVG